MKKLWFIALLLGIAVQLKAQQRNLTSSPLNAPLQALQKSANVTDHFTDSLTQNIIKQSLRQPSATAYLNSLTETTHGTGVIQNFYSRMPVARLHSNDPMPIAGRNLPLTDRMPVKRIQIIKPDTGGLGRVLLDYNKMPVNGK